MKHCEINYGNIIFRICLITYYTTCPCKKKLKTMMEINGRVDRQKMAKFKKIFDLLFFVLFYLATKIYNILCNSYDNF